MSGLVVTRLLGGLGNQLFQWAAGAAISRERGAELRIDPALLPAHIPVRLGEVGLDAPRWRADGAVAALLRAPGLWRVCRGTGWRPRLGRTRFVFDRLRGFDASIAAPLAEGGTLILTGYWQAPQWPAAVAAPMRAALPPVTSDAIAVHVRRGDYAADPSVRAYHGLLDGAYYARALEHLGAKAKSRPIEIYTDDPDFVSREGWVPRGATMAPPASDVEHLRRMAGCAHLIGANSSFSWWAGWLGDRAGRQVIVPERWWTERAGAIAHPAPAPWTRV